MPESWLKYIFDGETGSVVAAVLGSLVRGIIGPGIWDWKEFFLGCVTAVIFALWFVPGVVEYFSFGPRATISLSVLVGMIALPLARGLIHLAKNFRDNPNKYVGKRKDDYNGK